MTLALTRATLTYELAGWLAGWHADEFKGPVVS